MARAHPEDTAPRNAGAPELGLSAAAPASRARRRRWPWVLILLAVAVVAVAVLATRRAQSPFGALGAQGAGPRLAVGETGGRLALLPWTNATGERSQDWVSWGLMEMVAQALAETPGIALVPPEVVREALERRGLHLADPGARARARDAVRARGATRVLEVSVHRLDDGYRLEAGLDAGNEAGRDDGGGRVETTFEGPSLPALAERLATAVARGLAPDALAIDFGRTFSGNDFLDQLYAMGLDALRRDGPASARRYFEIALHHQPRFLLARARLADCDRLEGELQAARTARVALLQEAQRRGDRPLQARSLAELAELAALAGRFEEADELDRQAAAVFQALGDRAGRLRILTHRARLALAARDRARAEALYIELLDRQQAMADRIGQAETLRRLGALALDAGDLDQAQSTFERARELAREADDLDAEMAALASLGEIAARRGDGEAAEAAWAEAAAYYSQQDDRSRMLLLADQRARLARQRGDLELAETLYLDVVELAAELGDPAIEGAAAMALAEILLRKGYRHQARPHLDRAIELDREIDRPLALQRVIARFALAQEDYRLAAETLRAVKAADGAWSAEDEALLKAAERGSSAP